MRSAVLIGVVVRGEGGGKNLFPPRAMTHRWAGAGAALPAALLIHAPPRRQATRSSTRPPASRTTTKRSGATSSSPCCCLQFPEPRAGTLQFACLFSTTPHSLTLPTMPNHAPSHLPLTHAQAACTHPRASHTHPAVPLCARALLLACDCV